MIGFVYLVYSDVILYNCDKVVLCVVFLEDVILSRNNSNVERHCLGLEVRTSFTMKPWKL